MWDLFKAELLRFRAWAGAYATLHLIVLGFMSRLVDLAQQPSLVYAVIGCIYVLTGLLLGLYQMGGYRRPNAWLNLLHRPLPHWQVAIALFGAGAVMLAAAILLPLLVIAGWQESMTARVIDTRHFMLALSGLLVALCGYLSGGYAMLADKRYSVCALILLVLLYFSNATGVGAIAIQLLALAWLAMMIRFAFKPDLAAPPRSVSGTVATALPLQLGLWFVLLLAGFGIEFLWIMQGSHPNNMAIPTPGSTRQANNAEGKDLLRMGLAGSAAAEAPLWREQAAISEVFTFGPQIDALPVRHELTNLAPMEFDDDTRRVRWMFSHDSMRFEGYDIATRRAAGTLGADGDGAFASPVLPGPEGSLLSGGTVYQYDSDARLALPRARLPAGEVVTGFQRIGERVALLSNRALYFYDGGELINGDGVLTPRQRVSLPGRIGNLTRIDAMELLDGYLVSFTFTGGSHNGDGVPYQQIVRVDGDNEATLVARSELLHAGGPAYFYNSWYPSPLLYAAQKAVVDLFAGYAPGRDVNRPPVPHGALAIAGALMLLSLLGAIWHVGRTALPPTARIAWVVACGLLSVPALLSLWLLYPERERLDDLVVAQPAFA